uniref:Kinesin-like protein n=1 Tax=Microcebus murinus TaxID=30608 RepID=A0A8C5XX42_MICMU
PSWCAGRQELGAAHYALVLLVYGPADSQGEVFGDVRPLLTSLLDGYNVCVVAYGQTGSGKSYTMLGPPAKGGAPPSDAGIVPRAAEELFRLIAESPPPRPQVGVSVVEVYNNDVFDLLAKDSRAPGSGARRGLPAAAGDGRKEATTPTCEAVGSASELLRLVRGGLRRRATHATLVHEDSSRSHLIVTVTVTTAPGPGVSAASLLLPHPAAGAGRRRSACGPARPPDPAGRAERASAQLQLVDLAGSECAGGDAKFLVILCVSPGQRRLAQTLQGLGFGARARQVERGPARRRPSARAGEGSTG